MHTYDNRNRLREIWVSFRENERGSKVVSYDYNDASGLLTRTRHYVNKSTGGCSEEPAQTITRSYDIRDRLTTISSELFNYQLYYDDQTTNWCAFSVSVTRTD